MVEGHEAVSYVQTNTNLADVVHVTAEGDQTTTFKGFRSKADGSPQEVTIKVRDEGPGAGENRYTVEVYVDDIEPIRGNPAATLTEAISNADAHSSGLG